MERLVLDLVAPREILVVLLNLLVLIVDGSRGRSIWGRGRGIWSRSRGLGRGRGRSHVVLLRGVRLGLASVGGSGGSRDSGGRLVAISGDRRDLDRAGDTEDLADVNVVAVLVDLRVVGREDGGVQAVHGSDTLAGVVLLDDVGLAAVLALVAEADLVAGDEVTANVVDDTPVDSGQLEGGDIFSGGDAVANVILLDNVVTGAGTSVDGGSKERNSEQNRGEHFEDLREWTGLKRRKV